MGASEYWWNVRIPSLAITLLTIGALSIASCGGTSSPSATSSGSPAVSASATPIASSTITASTTTGASGTPAPTGPQTPSATVLPSCSAADLAGAIVKTGVATGTDYYTIGVTNTGVATCTLPGAPIVTFADAQRALIFVELDTSGPPCGSPPIDVATCVDNVPIQLPPGQPTPGGTTSPGQVTVTVAIAIAFNIDPSPILRYQATYLYLNFTDAGSAVSIPFGAPVTLISSGQASLRGYGPTS